MKKILLFFSVLFVSIFTLNLHLYASNSYYLMSCAEQNIPAGYYSSVDTSSEAKMRESLCNIISTGYVGNSYDKAYDIDYYADADPYNEGNIICIYTGQSLKNDKLHGKEGGWDREHIWCKSHGFKARNAKNEEWILVGNHAYNDCHHLRAAEHITNIHRSDKDFGEVSNPVATDDYGCKWTDSIFEPRDEVKGDIARMLFYMMIRYGEYSTETFQTYIDGNETSVAPGLLLVDEDTTDISTGNGRLGKLSTLLKWHYQDPVSDREIYRNNVIYQFQSNRNPFIDHPEYVDIAFENSIGSYVVPSQPSTPREPDTVARDEELYQEIGFEASEGYAATTTYNGHYLSGAEDSQWGAFYGTVATEAISGSQTMQMRWYTTNPSINPMCFMNYDVDNLSKIQFTAKGIANSKVEVLYSYDQGLTWLSKEVINISASKATYTSTITSNGGYGDLRVCLKIILPDTKPSSNSKFYIDDIKLYRCKDSAGSEFEKQATKANLNITYDESSVTNTETYYQKVTDINELLDGSEFIVSTYDNDKQPYALGAYNSTKVKYGSVSTTMRSDRLYATNPTLLTLQTGSVEGTYALKTGNSYLGNNDSGTGTSLKPLSSIDVNTSWNITIASDGLVSAILVEDSSNTAKRRVLSFNNSSTNQFFSCYQKKQTSEVVFYKKITSEVTNTVYTYNNTYLRFAGIITASMYQDIMSEDSNAVFGIALSKDGINYTNYQCNVTHANLVDGKLEDNPSGLYAYFAVKLLTPKENFESTVYAKAYVIVDGETFYMQEKVYSVNDLVNYYLANVTLTDEEKDLLGGLIQ